MVMRSIACGVFRSLPVIPLGMANYYHEARAHARSVKTMSEDNRRRAERRAEMATIHAEQPVNLLRVDGRACKIRRNQEQYDAVESMQGMLPWNGQQDNLIDRFDGRALLDFYQEPRGVHPPKSDKERQLDELVVFEAYRDLVKLMQQGLSEEEGLHAAMLENVELRATAVSTAAAAAGITSAGGTQKGPAQFGAVGFTYHDGAEGNSDVSSSTTDEDGSDEDDEEDERDSGEVADAVAKSMGLTNFGALLRRTEREEAGLAAGRAVQRKRPLSRKKAAERARRMAGQGLISAERPKVDAAPRAQAGHWDRLRPAGRRSPSYEPHSSRQERSRSRSASRSRSRSPAGRGSDRPRAHYITHFRSREDGRDAGAAAASHKGRHVEHGEAHRQWRGGAEVLDALPGGVDPAVDGGPVSLPPSATTMQGVRAGELWDREEERRREKREREKERLRERERQLERTRASTAKPVDKAKETPMERLKRLRAAQLNKQFQKDAVTVAQKRLAEEKDRQARLQIERAALGSRRSPSPIRSFPARSRSRTPSPGRTKSPSSRSRYNHRGHW